MTSGIPALRDWPALREPPVQRARRVLWVQLERRVCRVPSALRAPRELRVQSGLLALRACRVSRVSRGLRGLLASSDSSAPRGVLELPERLDLPELSERLV